MPFAWHNVEPAKKLLRYIRIIRLAIHEPFTLIDFCVKVVSGAGSSIVGAVEGGGPVTIPDTSTVP